MRAVLHVCLLLAASAPLCAAEPPWAGDPQVQEVLRLRAQQIAQMTAGRTGAGADEYSSTFVANTPDSGVVSGADMRRLFASGTVRYARVEQTVEYAGSHGPDLVVIMGEELVVPGEGAPNAGKRIHRRFTDVFRREQGQWRHDLRHANVIRIE